MTDDRLNRQMSYQVFHIGVYISLNAALIAVLFASDPSKIALNHAVLICSIILYSVAGAFGGIITSKLPNFESFDQFEESTIGPGTKFATGAGSHADSKAVCLGNSPAVWESREHFFFWLGSGILILTGILAAVGSATNIPNRELQDGICTLQIPDEYFMLFKHCWQTVAIATESR